MGTNYYLQRDKCKVCGRSDDPDLHIGKQSVGWPFLWQQHPLVINDLSDWLKMLGTPGSVIVDENKGEYTLDYFIQKVTIIPTLSHGNFERQVHEELIWSGMCSEYYRSIERPQAETLCYTDKYGARFSAKDFS